LAEPDGKPSSWKNERGKNEGGAEKERRLNDSLGWNKIRTALKRRVQLAIFDAGIHLDPQADCLWAEGHTSWSSSWLLVGRGTTGINCSRICQDALWVDLFRDSGSVCLGRDIEESIWGITYSWSRSWEVRED